MEIDRLISLMALCVPLVLSVAGAAIRICNKLEKISVVLENMMTRSECAILRVNCPALQREKSHCNNADASGSPISAARRMSNIPRL